MSLVSNEDIDSVVEIMSEPTLTPFQKGIVRTTMKRLRSHFDAVSKPLPEKSTDTPPTNPMDKAGSTIHVTLDSDSGKLLFKEYLDQALPGSFDLLSQDTLAGIRAHYQTRTGANCPEHKRPTDEQLSALAWRLGLSCTGKGSGGTRVPPFVDFCGLRAGFFSACPPPQIRGPRVAS